MFDEQILKDFDEKFDGYFITTDTAYDKGIRFSQIKAFLLSQIRLARADERKQAYEDGIEAALQEVIDGHVVAKKSYPSDSWDCGVHDALFSAQSRIVNLIESARKA